MLIRVTCNYNYLPVLRLVCLEENINGNIDAREIETAVDRNGSTEVKLTEQGGTKDIKEEEYQDPLKKPLILDDGRWAVFSW